MRETLIIIAFVLCCGALASILWTVIKTTIKNWKIKKNGGEKSKESVLGLVSGEIFFGGAFLTVAYILKKAGTDIGALIDISIAVLILGFAWGVFIKFIPYNRRRVLSFTLIMPVAIYLAGVLTFFAVYYYGLREGAADSLTGDFWASVLAALHHSARLFTLDGGYSETITRITEAVFADQLTKYIVFIAVLYFVAAFATFTTLLTIVKNFSAKVKYWLSAVTIWRSVHVFSSLSDESLALAASLTTVEKDAKLGERFRFFLRRIFFRLPVIVFASTSDGAENVSKDLVEEAKERGAILFSKDISSIRFRKHNHFYYVMGTNEGEKLRAAKELITYYGPYGNTLYVFSETAQSEMFLNALDPKNMKLIRVNAIQSLIYRALYDNGIRLFKGAMPKDPNDPKSVRVISAVIVGLGLYGKEMLKALTWYCQMEGYRLKINAFDNDDKAEAKLRKMCPELMEMSGNESSGEPHYSIDVYSMDIDTDEFYKKLSEITDVSYVFVCLGEDERNLQISKSIRELYEGLKRTKKLLSGRPSGTPDIETVIYDSSIKEMLSTDWTKNSFGWCDHCIDGGRNFKNQPYRIHVIGDLKSFYSVNTLTGGAGKDTLVKDGEAVHTRWAEADLDNSKHRDAIRAHVKANAKDGNEVIWLVTPHLDDTLPSVRSIKIEDVKSADLKKLGLDQDRFEEIICGLFALCEKKKHKKNDPLAKEDKLTEEDYANIVRLRARFYFVFNVLTKTYDISIVDKKEDFDAIKTPEQTQILIPEEFAPGGSSPASEPSAELSGGADTEGASSGDAVSVADGNSKEKKTARSKEEIAKIEKEKKKFWRYTYYYRSSLAKAIHEKLRRDLIEADKELDKKCKTDTEGKYEREKLIRSESLREALMCAREERSEAQITEICKVEHLRWSAFTRAEGYSRGDSKYDLAKLHNDLISTEYLTPSELRKDA